MAVRREELGAPPEAVVLRFPVDRARRRLAMRERVQRRRRILAAVVTVGLAAVLVGGFVGGEASPASKPDAPAAVVVDRGETLWDIAARYGPEDGDPRAYIEALEELNGLHGTLRAGDRIKLPD
jgi:nucleoid-associated protein YgaU